MKRFLKIAVLAGGASLLAASPILAQDLNALNPLAGLGIDLDPFHIFTPAPPPPAPGFVAQGGPHHHHHHFHHPAARHHGHHAAAHHHGRHLAGAHHRARHLAKA